jgi:hypothetical protein
MKRLVRLLDFGNKSCSRTFIATAAPEHGLVLVMISFGKHTKQGRTYAVLIGSLKRMLFGAETSEPHRGEK